TEAIIPIPARTAEFRTVLARSLEFRAILAGAREARAFIATAIITLLPRLFVAAVSRVALVIPATSKIAPLATRLEFAIVPPPLEPAVVTAPLEAAFIAIPGVAPAIPRVALAIPEFPILEAARRTRLVAIAARLAIVPIPPWRMVVAIEALRPPFV